MLALLHEWFQRSNFPFTQGNFVHMQVVWVYLIYIDKASTAMEDLLMIAFVNGLFLFGS